LKFPFASLPENLAAFCAELRRAHGFGVGPGELADAARALEIADLEDERAVRDSLRPVLCGRLDEVVLFDRAFDEFFFDRQRGLPEPPGPSSPRSIEREPGTPVDGRDRIRTTEESPTPERLESGGGPGAVRDVADAGDEAAAGVLRASYSPLEAEGEVPDLEPPDGAWREAAAAVVRRVRAGLSRRWRPAARGQRFDFRRTLRNSLHTGGDVVTARWRARPRRRPSFVLLVDGSRSMGAMARPALRAAVAFGAVTRDVETFTFSTALRRVTLEARRAAAGERRALELREAWGGGTAIGGCLQEFLQQFGGRLLRRDTVVLIASDGLDIGEPERLREAMAALARRAAAIVWLNPLLETPGYEPTALGMSAARPFIDVLAAVNDAAGLARLARRLRIG
jgi:uncharacterized protein with von Willebrand factor type A (vWA) domain